MSNNNYIALAITFVAALLWLRINDYAATKNWVGTKLSRKFIHIGTGPIFVLCWLLFDNTPSARYLAAVVPLVITLQFALVGLGIIKDDAAVQAMSRTGDRKEILRGPLYYGLIFVVLTVVFWKDTPIGIIALMIMCGGDGLAEIVGTRWGRFHLPWAPNKTLLGSIAMFVGGWTLSLIIVSIYVGQEVFSGDYAEYIFPINLIAVASTAAESFGFPDIDNITVTLAAVFFGYMLFIP